MLRLLLLAARALVNLIQGMNRYQRSVPQTVQNFNRKAGTGCIGGWPLVGASGGASDVPSSPMLFVSGSGGGGGGGGALLDISTDQQTMVFSQITVPFEAVFADLLTCCQVV